MAPGLRNCCTASGPLPTTAPSHLPRESFLTLQVIFTAHRTWAVLMRMGRCTNWLRVQMELGQRRYFTTSTVVVMAGCLRGVRPSLITQETSMASPVSMEERTMESFTNCLQALAETGLVRCFTRSQEGPVELTQPGVCYSIPQGICTGRRTARFTSSFGAPRGPGRKRRCTHSWEERTERPLSRD